MNLTLHLILCGVLILITAAAFIYRNRLENREDPYIHLRSDERDSSVINAQAAMARRLETIDKVKNGLLAAVILYILTIIAIVTYTAWNRPGA